MRSDLPSGTVTFLFTDVEDSTKLLHEFGEESYAEALSEHRRVIREACAAEGGIEVDTQGDAFLLAFPTAPGALEAAEALTERLAAEGPIRVRVGVHTGTPLLTDEGYVGHDLHRAARIAAAGHGGQVLVSSSTERLVDVELRDLGEHRFKDLGAPERVFQLGAHEFPPLKTLHQTNLPIPQTPFLGRELELGKVMELLGRDDVRLLTLTGPGGTGKTRLAAQAAGALADRYRDGVFWVPLAPLRDPALVVETAGQVLGARDSLAIHIGEKEILLLLDNFEQVVVAAPELGSLLAECPKLELLVTSREPLHLSAEHEYAVPPFAHEEGVGFFLARARAVKPDFQTNGSVSEICRRLDDLPLALELAAARVKALTPEQILSRLEQRLPLLTGGARDAPERQRTLRATIEWSYDLLSPDEQQLFARLSVFRGGCTLEAAEEVCDADLDTMQSLVDKSLLRFSEERYWTLGTVREFGRELLVESRTAEEVRARHAQWCAVLTGKSESEWTGPTAGDWYIRIKDELDNVRSAIDWSVVHDRLLALSIVSDLWYFWGQTARTAEAERLLDLAWSEEDPVELRKRALRARTVVALAREDPDAVMAVSKQRLELAQATDDLDQEAAAMGMLAAGAQMAGDRATARTWYESSLTLARELAEQRGDFARLTGTLGNFARLEHEEGNLERSRELLEEYMTIVRASRSEPEIAWAAKELAGTLTDQGALDEARALLAEGLAISVHLGQTLNVGDLILSLAALMHALGRTHESAVLLGAAEGFDQRSGLEGKQTSTYYWNTRAKIIESLGEAEFESAAAEGRRLDEDAAVLHSQMCLSQLGPMPEQDD